MSEPTPSIKQLREDLNTLDMIIGADTETLTRAYHRLGRALDELATLRAEVEVLRQTAEVLEVEKSTLMESHAARCWERDQARARVAEQEAWRGKAEWVLQGVAGMDDEEAIGCPYCRETPDYLPLRHDPDCPIVAARALLGEGGQP